MTCFTHTFPNGLRLIHLPSDSPVAYCGFAVNAGARDEDPGEYGLAHFVEHLLFKGTARRKARHILNRMDSVGAELNAYTTKEDTFVYSVFMEEHFGRAFELLTDIVFRSTFPPAEIEKEINVIRDEIETYNDNPSELIFDEFEDLLFCGHPLGHNILGNEDSLRSFTSAAGLDFTRRFYLPCNMVFFSMGRFRPEKILRLAEEAWNGSCSPVPLHRRTPPPVLPAQNKCLSKETHQTHLILGGTAYSMYEDDRKRIALFLLNSLLGGGMNSRLNLALREKHGLTYGVESNLTAYTDTGLASIYFGTDAKHVGKALHLVGKELSRVCETRLSTSQLAALKKQVKGQMALSADNRETLFLFLGKQFLHHDRYETLPEVFAKIERISAGEILEVANEVFAPARLSGLTYD
ncbi:MAG: insulinase family protein [Tannerellaceae bacterium]|jgi:predicted Zn-dependent peptidase|nr:insulinase family protein [Tannerellaceae bacterium]